MSSRIAIRYATPLMELAIEQNVLDGVRQDMLQFLDISEAVRDFKLMLSSPVIPHLKKAEILKAMFEKKFQPLTIKFFDIVARKNREAHLVDTAQVFLKRYNQHKGIQEAEVITAIKLDNTTLKKFEATVEKLSGKKAALSATVDDSVIGGYILKMDDKMVDDSVAHQLNALKYKFIKESK